MELKPATPGTGDPPPWAVAAAATALLTLVLLGKAISGPSLPISSLSLLSILAVAWYLGPRAGLAFAMAGSAASLVGHAPGDAHTATARFLVLLGVGVCVALAAAAARRAHDRHVAAAEELGAALAVLRTVRGRLGLCPGCHRVHDGAHPWDPLERFLERRTLATFVHRTCPDCELGGEPTGSGAADDR